VLVHIVKHSLLSWLDRIPYRHLQCRQRMKIEVKEKRKKRRNKNTKEEITESVRICHQCGEMIIPSNDSISQS
jgi:CO dehydrogenase/acetyl-CoA synthase alpha subunit